MNFRFKLHRQDGSTADITVGVDADATVGHVASAIADRDPAAAVRPTRSTLAVLDDSGQSYVKDSKTLITDSGLRSGDVITVLEDTTPVGASSAPSGMAPTGAVLTVLNGPQAGSAFKLPVGTSQIGRGRHCTVQLVDPMVSVNHARIIVGDVVEIVDNHSSNGVLVDGELVPRAVLRSEDRVTLGETVVSVASGIGRSPAVGVSTGHAEHFNRSPRVDPRYEGLELEAPEPPQPKQQQRFPLVTSLAPLFMGVVLFAVTKSVYSVMFIALSPIMLVGGYWENRRATRKAFEEAVDLFRGNLAALVVQLHAAAEEERVRRCIEHPGTADVVNAIDQRSELLWTRRPEHRSFGEVRLGLGRQPSRTRVEVTRRRNSTPELFDELSRVIGQFEEVDRVPVVGSLAESGSIGVGGPDELAVDVARGLLVQFAALHSPAELVICGVASPQSAVGWDWLKWLPHVGSDHSPLVNEPLASTPVGCVNLVAEISDLIADRAGEGRAGRSGDGDASSPLPLVVLVVADDAPIDRARLVQLAETGPPVGVHLLWVATSRRQLPAACRIYVDVERAAGVVGIGKVIEGTYAQPVLLEPLDLANATRLARSLAPVVDSGALLDNVADVPGHVSFLAETGVPLSSDPNAVRERWIESNSLRGDGQPRRLRRDNTLRAFVGRTSTDPLYLDLRTQGPHALVGGTTGAGKSEFLQTWVLGMATAHSPQRVTFLFVDYKGGSAFADCVSLPHSVGLVTDLSPHLVQRALTSLNAELRYREHVLNRRKAKDLLELERRGDPEAPPSLVIVVDEFAALVQEVPEFVDGVVNIAQRGRSLGLHLILATQRPAGVIKDNLRANTNLRVALRMADEDDSKDVIGTALAGTFDPDLPGRGVVKTGPGRLAVFQTGYVGGWSTGAPPDPTIQVRGLGFGRNEEWVSVKGDEPESEPVGELGAPDIQRIVSNVQAAAEAANVATPRRPWLPALAHSYDLASFSLPRRDSELVFGVIDRPAEQSQELFAFRPDTDGHLAVFGTGGSGKSALLRSLAVTAGLTVRGGPCFVYGLDFGSRGLTMLEALPHVGSIIGSDDAERTARLVSELRATVEERAVRYAAVNADSIDEYRRLAGQPDEPRILLLIDGFAAFRSAYEIGPTTKVFDQLIAIASGGRPVGVHLAISSDRLGSVPSSLLGSIQLRVALRLGNEMDESMLGVPRDGFGEMTPPGRGFVDGLELQVAVLSGASDVATQATAMARIAESMRRVGTREAPPVQRLPDDVALSSLPVTVEGRPAFGVADETLGPIGFERSGVLLVTGPARSGRTTAVATLLASLRRGDPGLEVAYFGTARSALGREPWNHRAIGSSEWGPLAEQLTARWQSSDSAQHPVVVLDGVGEMINSEADYALQDLLKACRSAGVFVIADGETSDVQGSWPLLQQIKASRHGLVLQPDQTDGDAIFRTSFPRMSRAEFPQGRGMYVYAGRVQRVQVAQS